MGWEELSNGLLLKRAADAGFDLFVSIDKKIEYEQNLKTLRIPILIIDAPSNALPVLIQFAPFVLKLLETRLDRLLFVVEKTGFVHRLTAPRE